MDIPTKKTAAMSGQQYGDWVESQIQAGLDQLMQEGPVFFARLYDTRSANSFLPKQAGDFLGTCHSKGFSLEVKGSVVHESLMQGGALRKLVKDHQSLGAYLQHRAGGKGLVVFRSRVSGLLELWDAGDKVRDVYITSRAKLGPSDGLIWSTTCTDANLVSEFKEIFVKAFT